MRHIFTLLAAIALSLLLGGGDCLAMGQADSTASQSSSSKTSPERADILRAKKNAQDELKAWTTRLYMIGKGGFRDYGKPGEDPTNVMRFASVSNNEDDFMECNNHISMLKENIKFYDKELEKLDKAESEKKGGTEGGDGGGDGGGCGC